MPISQTTIRACPVCDHSNAEVLHTQSFVLPQDTHVPSRYEVVLCTWCGVAYADTDLAQRHYEELYTASSRYAAGPAAHTSERDLVRFRKVASAIEEFVPDRQARILDIGCANGQLLAALGERGYEYLIGVDPSPACVREAGKTPRVRAFVGSLFDLPNLTTPCDVAILSHVLEHIRDVRPALENLKRQLSSAAVLYVEVPDASRYADCVWSPFQDFNTEHINHFSTIALSNLLRRAGFRPETLAAKELLTAPDMPYPAIYAVARLDCDVSREIERDIELGSALRLYVQLSRQLMNAVDERLRTEMNPGVPILVWGTGELTAKLLADTCLRTANIQGFVDGNPANQGRVLCGLRIMAPSEMRSGPETIVVASILHHEAILHEIRGRGLRNPVVRLGELGRESATERR